METLSSSPCQLGLGVVLRHLSLSPYKIRKKRKFEKAEEFATRIKKVYEKAKVVLRKSQEEIQKYANRKKSKPEEYKVEDWVLLIPNIKCRKDDWKN